MPGPMSTVSTGVETPLSGTAFVSDLDEGRRPGTLADMHNLMRLVHMCSPLHVLESQVTEPQDLEGESRDADRGPRRGGRRPLEEAPVE